MLDYFYSYFHYYFFLMSGVRSRAYGHGRSDSVGDFDRIAIIHDDSSHYCFEYGGDNYQMASRRSAMISTLRFQSRIVRSQSILSVTFRCDFTREARHRGSKGKPTKGRDQPLLERTTSPW